MVNRSRRSGRSSLSLAVLVCAACAAPARPTPRRGPVVVAIIVDQLAAWIADERLPLLPADGGFARLRREGTWVRELRYAHGITETGPGHAALYSGAVPRDSGVWGNEQLDDGGVKRSLFRDPEVRLVTPDGLGKVGVSARVVRVPLVADRLREAQPRATILSLSLKERSAILGGGRRPDVVLWFDRWIDSFVSSTAFARELPPWVAPIAGPAALRARREGGWWPLDPRFIAAHARVPDDAPGEGDQSGFGVTFPHDFAATPDPARAFRSTPAADEVVIDLALAALAAHPQTDAPTYLALSLSGTDYVAHLFGTSSHEAWDALLRLDAALARLFATLDARVGADGWSLVLSADHGVSRVLTTRIMQPAFVARIEDASREAIGEDHVAGLVDPYVQLTGAGRALPPEKRERLVAALARAIRAIPGVADVRDARLTPATCPPEADESIDALLCRAMPPTDDPRLYVVVADGAFFDPDMATHGGGVNHGTPRVEDRAVPMIVRAPGRVAAGRVVDGPRSYRLFTRTLSALLGLEALPEL